jgi:site-specific recombinase XerD
MVAVSELVSGLDTELVRLGYKASTMVWYRGCWRRLERFFASRGAQEFSLDVAMAWVDQACGGFFDKEQAGTLKATDVYLFRQHRSKLSRGGIAWILRKYQVQAADPALANARLSPHIPRHSRAMHLYDSGVPLPYIRDIIGHVDLSTTEIYAQASTEAKRKALEAVYNDVVTADLAEWNQDPELLNWLATL